MIPKEGDVVQTPSGRQWLVKNYMPESTLTSLVSADSDEVLHVLSEYLKPASPPECPPKE